MITDQEIQKIFDWADKNDIQNRGTKEEILGDTILVWRKGIPKKKKNLLEMEYFDLDSWRYEKLSTIPNELFKLPKLKGLSISLKQLNHIDRQNLQKIIFLKICAYSSTKKDFIEFTDTLKTYTNLEYLHILNGKLNKISEDIFYLNNLKYLKLYGWENIQELPSDIKKLNKLEVFALEACHLLTTISSDSEPHLSQIRDCGRGFICHEYEIREAKLS